MTEELDLRHRLIQLKGDMLNRLGDAYHLAAGIVMMEHEIIDIEHRLEELACKKAKEANE